MRSDPTKPDPPRTPNGAALNRPVVFVGRRAEQERLDAFLAAALESRGGLALVAGEAGIGKTALLEVFVADAGSRHPDLVAAVGNCNAQTGITDPLLPLIWMLLSAIARRSWYIMMPL